MASFNGRLRDLRKQKGMTQSELADIVQVNKQTISQYERGVRRPDFETLDALCDFFNVSTDYILGKEDVTLRYVDSDEMRAIDDAYVKVRIYGEVAAGVPMEMIDDIYDEEEIPKDMTRGGKEYFGLVIKGDSMEPRMKSGDIVLALKQDTAESGDTVIATVNGYAASCKKYRRLHDGIELVSLNSAYEPMFFSHDEVERLPVTILGKVVELRAKI